MEDRLISLKQVLDTVDEMPVMKDNNGMEFIERSLTKTRIGVLPSAQPERKRGRWINVVKNPHVGTFLYKCSECGDRCYEMPVLADGEPVLDFCPTCGADMRGEQE